MSSQTCVLSTVLATAYAVSGWCADSGYSYAANRTRVYADARPPLYWDATNNVNILWKAPLPNWSNGSPLFVPDKSDQRPGAGRIFVMSEPLDYAPILTAYDALTGKELWRRELDPVAGFPAAEQAKMRELARDGWAWKTAMVRLWNDVRDYIDAHPEMFEGNYKALKDGARPEFERVFGKRLGDLGLTFKSIIRGAGGEVTQFTFSDERGPASERIKRLQSLGLAWEHWAYYGTYTGLTFGTPASDGKRVFTVTGQGLYSCHDLDGRLLWQQRFWPENGQKYQGLFSTSPVYAQGLFTSQGGVTIRAFDAATGAVRWSAPMDGCFGQNGATPAVVELGGEVFLLTVNVENPKELAGSNIIRVRDGKVCGKLPGFTSEKMAIAGPIAGGDIVVGFLGDFAKRELAAHRLAYDAAAEAVAAKELWRRPMTRLNAWHACISDGDLHTQNAVLDALTGEMRIEKLPHAHNNYCWWSGMLVGDYYLTIDHAAGDFHYRDARQGREIGRNALPKNPPEVHDAAKVRANGLGSQWRILGAGTPEAVGERLYVRSFDYLWCIGPSVNGTPRDDPKVVTAIRAATRADELVAWLANASAQYRYEAVKRVAAGAVRTADVMDRVRALAAADPYAEIRAAALRALGLEAKAPGWAELRRQLVAKAERTGHLKDQDTLLTLRALGAAAESALIAMLADDDAPTKRVAAHVTGGLAPCGDALRDALIAVLRTSKDEWVTRQAAPALALWRDDSAVEAFFRMALNSNAYYQVQPDAYAYLLRATPAGGQAKLLKDVVERNTHGDVRREAILKLVARAQEQADADSLRWIVARARGGDGLCVEQLSRLNDAEQRRTVMLDLLTSEKSVAAATRAMFWHSIEPVAAGRAFRAAMGRLEPRELGHAMEGIWHCGDPEGRKLGAEILGELLGHADRQVRAWALQGLGDLGAASEPYLSKIESLQPGEDKGLAELRQRVIEQISEKLAERQVQ